MNKMLKYTGLIVIALAMFSACTEKNDSETQKVPRYMGYIENTQLNVTTRMPGKITAIYVDEGDTVKESQKVAQLDTREILANRKAMTAQLANILKNKRRLENLFTAGAVSQQKVDMIETQYEVLMNKINALDTKIEDMTITSPIDGIVNVKILEVGQMMPPGMPVVIVTDPKGTWARFSVPETCINQINLGQVFDLETNIPDLTLKGKVISILPMATFATHTPTTLRDDRDIRSFDVKLKIIDNQMQCKPGMSAFLTLKPIEKISDNKKKN
ncbi:MAG: hypothetical protein B6D61_11615 [Bacteroidetes bacterium 4484_249]|nr:MAG: hypothetical protein B6D61_11615 [Bacteroidetes bacterium 4484_249]